MKMDGRGDRLEAEIAVGSYFNILREIIRAWVRMMTVGIEKMGPEKTVQGLKTDWIWEETKEKVGSRDDSEFSRLSGSEEDSVIDLNKKYRRKKCLGR